MNELNAVLKIGNVHSVKGRKVDVIVDKSKNASHLLYNGDIIKNVSVGGYIKITKGFEELVGKIEGEFISTDKSLERKEYAHNRDKISRVLNVSLVGYFDKLKFKQGIKELPLIENECYLLTQDEFNRVHHFIKDINGVPDIPIRIGSLASEKGKEISVGVNSLFASHIGIFGNTGSGKSYTLAGLYHKLFKAYQNKSGFKANAKFVIIDFNGEYLNGDENDNIITTFENKNLYKLSTRKQTHKKYPISEEEINDIDFWSIFLTATEKTQKPFIKRALSNDFYFSRFNNESDFRYALSSMLESLITNKVDKGDIIQFIYDVSNSVSAICLEPLIQEYQQSLHWHSSSDKYYYEANNVKTYLENFDFNNGIPVNTINRLAINTASITYLEKIRLRIVFQFYNEIARFNLNTEHISPLMKRLKTIEQLDSVITVSSEMSDNFLDIISLSDVNTSMKKVLPLLICKQIYDKKKQERNDKKYLNIIIDEAHNILSYSSQRESETWKDYRLETFEEIIKEGRKFGVFLTVASQRPSDISSTIISQLHNYFLHRLINNKDIEAVERTVSYLDQVSFEALSILPTGTCILAGLSAQVPIIIEIDKIDEGFEPYNKTIKPTDYWENPDV
ncbi:hypothetical protein LX69_03384 [Breznakibacter xylanolyticus]|uniref:Helicase HerA central domain-containing protein n=1 Tax=Breznakibacter xylanolyticus TaxID=990 RepID=A0A2W7PM20_9BACT|nr:ATP-binding protein [Breznakibacter xylanolyticus]PZX10369.1 hypothetical protein LX69_03384 [Breznakibacter xylanolyticus]